MSRMVSTLAVVAAMLAGGTALADRALVVDASGTGGRGFLGGGSKPDVASALRAAGFEVIVADPGSAATMRQALSQFMKGLAAEPRVLVHLSGQFVQAGGRSWLLQAGLDRQPDLATVDDVGLSVQSVLAVAGRVPGAAIVTLGTEAGEGRAGDGLKRGPALGNTPQGVTTLEGPAAAMADFVTGAVLAEGRDLGPAIGAAKEIAGGGFLPGRFTFIPADEARPAAAPDAGEVERAIWQATAAQDSVAAYESYLDRYPKGIFAEEARQEIAAIRSEPARAARLSEEGLGLSRQQRQAIQRQLTLLGLDPRGVDGVFGPGSRAAITRFQEKNGFPATGFLDERQIERIALQAERRQAELDAEAARAALERERLDRDAWATLGEQGDEAGLRTYLERFPEGQFAPIARERLERIEAGKREQAAAQDRRDWDSASEAGTEAAYTAYLKAHPEGAFAAEAKARLTDMKAAADAGSQAALAEENALGLNPVSRLMIERRLKQLGLGPGEIDGNFDDRSRAAIRKFQQQNGLEPTGYMNQAVVARMLADLGDLLQLGR